MEVNSPFLTRKTELIKSISTAYSKYYNKYTSNDIVNGISALNVLCNSDPTGKVGPNACSQCIGTFMDISSLNPCTSKTKCGSDGICSDGVTKCPPNSEGNCTSPSSCYYKATCPASGICGNGNTCIPGENTCNVCQDGTPCKLDADMLKLAANLGASTGVFGAGNPNGVCYPACSCTVKDIVFSNIIIFKSSDIISPKDEGIQKIAQDVYDDMVKKFGDEYQQSFSDNITKIVVDISQSATENILRTVTSMQTITIKDGNAYGVHITAMINAVMSAILNSDVSMNLVDDVMSQISAQMRNMVDRELLSNFEYVFEEGKTYFIWTGIVLVVLILSILGMLIYRAIYG